MKQLIADDEIIKGLAPAHVPRAPAPPHARRTPGEAVINAQASSTTFRITHAGKRAARMHACIGVISLPGERDGERGRGASGRLSEHFLQIPL